MFERTIKAELQMHAPNCKYYFKDVTLLVTHYNRSSSLQRLLQTFEDRGIGFGDIVVSDDGSRAEHVEALRDLQPRYSFQLITTPKNKGLGNNINKGQKSVHTKYTLYVQEDFIPTELFAEKFSDAVGFMDNEDRLDLVRFYSYIPYPHTKPYKKGFSEMVYRNMSLKYKKIYFYSDHPHLRRSNFLERFGDYPEGISGDKTEYRMCVSVIQNKAKGLFYDDFKSLFVQSNSEAEPSQMTRKKLTYTTNPFISVLRDVYRQFKYNFDVLFTSR